METKRNYTKWDVIKLAGAAAFHDGQIEPIGRGDNTRFFPKNLNQDYMWRLSKRTLDLLLLPTDDGKNEAKFYRLPFKRTDNDRIDFATEVPHAYGEDALAAMRSYTLFVDDRKISER